MRTSLAALALALVVATGAVAAADDFGGWRFKVPQDYTGTTAQGVFVMQKVTAPTFCLMVVYESRAMTQPLATEAAAEWKNHVAGTLKVSGVKHHGDGTTKSSSKFTATAGTIENGDDRFSAILYTVAAGQSVGSVLLSSNNQETLTGCRSGLTELLDSLALAPVAAPAAAPVASTAESIAGHWAASASFDSGEWGSTRRQYTFASDGTYKFYSETWGGKYNSKRWRLITESGTYALSSATLTITPTAASGVDKVDTKSTPFKVALEKAAYAWQRHYFEGIKDWNLILTTSTKTLRDGEFASNDQYPSSYMYSPTYAPDWKFPP